MSDYHIIVEADEARDETMAGEVARVLCEAYPGHPWHVRIGGGVIAIKHMKLSGKWAMIRKYARVTFDAKVLKHEIVMAAGEFLERAGLVRGLATGERPKAVEGIPQKDMAPA